MTDRLGVCVPFAVAAAALNATAALLQAHTARSEVRRGALHLGLLADLVRRPLWLLGLGAAVTAFLCQATALTFGPVTLVQPILVTSLLVTVSLRALLTRRSPPALTVLGAAVCAGGLAAFLALAHPLGGSREITASNVVPLAPVLLVVLGGSLLLAARRSDNVRAVFLAVAAGVLYGVTAGLTELVTRQVTMSVTLPLRHWELYVAVACGVLGVQLNQSAFQTGTVPAPVAVITATDPAVSVAIGVFWLGERLDTSTVPLALEALAFAGMVLGIALLARETGEQVTRSRTRS